MGISYSFGGGKGILYAERCHACEQIRKRRQDRRQRQHRWRIAIGKSIPVKFRGAHLRHLPCQLRDRLITCESSGVFLWGPTGVGKSFALSAAARQFICENRTVARITFFELCRNIRQTYHADNGPNESSILRGLIFPDVLVLEDIGSNLEPNQTASAFEKRVLLDLIDTRAERGKVTFLSGNLPVEGLEAAFGSRIGSRLHEYRVIKLQGRDRRRN